MKTKCDLCRVEQEQDELVNITPQVTDEIHDLKEGYDEFDGMVCEDCYKKISVW